MKSRANEGYSSDTWKTSFEFLAFHQSSKSSFFIRDPSSIIPAQFTVAHGGTIAVTCAYGRHGSWLFRKTTQPLFYTLFQHGGATPEASSYAFGACAYDVCWVRAPSRDTDMGHRWDIASLLLGSDSLVGVGVVSMRDEYVACYDTLAFLSLSLAAGLNTS